MRQPHHRSAQVWHVFSRITQFYLLLISLYTIEMHHIALLPSEPKLVLRARTDVRLSWPRHHIGEKTVWLYTFSHASLGKFVVSNLP